MAPSEYFPAQYRADLSIFAEGEVPDQGPFWMLCGMTLGRLFEPGRPERYFDSCAFLCVVYGLNLMHQGVYTYFPDDHQRWVSLVEPFPDLRGCPTHHGSVSTPGSLLRFADDPSYIPGAKPIFLNPERVCDFTRILFRVYLPRLSEHAGFVGLTPSRLFEKLRADPDCREFSRYAC